MATVNEYIENLDSEQQKIAHKLRKIILSVDDQICESIKWNVPTYSTGKDICSIIAHKNHVNIQVFYGSGITLKNVLVGTGKNMRHLKIVNITDIDLATIQEIVMQSVKLAAR